MIALLTSRVFSITWMVCSSVLLLFRSRKSSQFWALNFLVNLGSFVFKRKLSLLLREFDFAIDSAHRLLKKLQVGRVAIYHLIEVAAFDFQMPQVNVYDFKLVDALGLGLVLERRTIVFRTWP